MVGATEVEAAHILPLHTVPKAALMVEGSCKVPKVEAVRMSRARCDHPRFMLYG